MQPHRKSIAILLALILFASLIACGTTATTTKVATPPTAGSTPTPTIEPTQTPIVAAVGDTLIWNNIEVTLVSVKKLAGDEFTRPKAGHQFIVVHLKIVNKGSSEVDYNPFDFHVKSGTGNITDEECCLPSTYTANNILDSGKLSPGGSVVGDIGFQVVKGDHAAELTWQPNILGNAGENGWLLGL